jgi:hypothetical protein
VCCCLVVLTGPFEDSWVPFDVHDIQYWRLGSCRPTIFFVTGCACMEWGFWVNAMCNVSKTASRPCSCGDQVTVCMSHWSSDTLWFCKLFVDVFLLCLLAMCGYMCVAYSICSR